MRPLEIYIHIPFCIRKCRYCDFLSAPSTIEERQDYVTGLCRKIRSYGDLAEAYHVVTVFIGGGTPSVLEGAQILDIMDAVRGTFPVDAGAEISMEMNPGTATKEKLRTIRHAGINRLSIGLQSTDDSELKMLGRIHTYEDFLHTYEMARETGFANVNVDLMSAIPFQSVDSWDATLIRTAELGPEHISAYSLIIEEGTPFFDRYGNGKRAKELPTEEEERQMYMHTRTILEEYGYHRYEISNYARPGYECRHNLGYWDRAEYLGIGTGAASLLQGYRFTEGEEPVKLSEKEQMEEFMFLGLRKTEGVSREAFCTYFNRSMERVFGKVMTDMGQKGLLEIEEDAVRLTDKGMDISNYVMSAFLLGEEE